MYINRADKSVSRTNSIKALLKYYKNSMLVSDIPVIEMIDF